MFVGVGVAGGSSVGDAVGVGGGAAGVFVGVGVAGGNNVGDGVESGNSVAVGSGVSGGNRVGVDATVAMGTGEDSRMSRRWASTQPVPDGMSGLWT